MKSSTARTVLLLLVWLSARAGSAEPTEGLAPRVQIEEGLAVIVGGWDPTARDDLGSLMDLDSKAATLKAHGVTSHEGYVRWGLCEPSRGHYDWTVYDRYVDVYKRHGLKWTPFLIVGPAYSLPDWYYKQEGAQGYICLEHGQESDIQSLWNPELRAHVARFIEAFCRHFAPTGVIESILLGVTGNYGEAIYPATGNDWTSDIHGEYHTHRGLWAGDTFAVMSFRRSMRTKYGDIEALNTAWNASYSGFDAVHPLQRDEAPSDRAWLDFCHWYADSMTDYTRFWLEVTREHFPSGQIYVCTGGDAPPEHGADFGAQCKAAAAFGAGVRITNESSKYDHNFALTRWVSSAAQQYGATFSFEPASEVTPEGIVGRIYNATTSGARGLHFYYHNLFGSEPASACWRQWGSAFSVVSPVVEVFVYYPQTHILLNGQDFIDRVKPLRDRFDFGYLSDEQIRDNGLAQAKALVLLHGNVSEADVWEQISRWVQEGGTLCYASGMGRLRTVEGDEAPHEALCGPAAVRGAGRVEIFEGDPATAAYRDFICQRLKEVKTLSEATRQLIEADGRDDGVFASIGNGDLLLWLNQSAVPYQMPNGETLSPDAIGRSRITAGHPVR